MAVNMTSTSSLASTPLCSRASSPISMKEVPQVQPTTPNLISLSSGYPLPEIPDQIRQDHSPPLPSGHVMLHELVFCGKYQPCRCLPSLRAQQHGLLPPHYPVYLPVGHQPCSLDCGAHRVHGDNVHPRNPDLCPCSPPRLQPSVASLHYRADPVPTDEPALPQDFQPCGYYCGYESCQCLRQYSGRDFAS